MHIFAQQVQLEVLNALVNRLVKQLYDQGESSCKQNKPRATDKDDEEPDGARGAVSGGDGGKCKGKQVVDVDANVGDDVGAEGNEQLECLVNLDDDIFVDVTAVLVMRKIWR
ncbi:hypothetical protein L1987_03452 [Smallanthus sonchifolius]|uniref:Uncharacterized protein n=1 Tax=Smallanthus sonchifolius TaxID=185202 RepID=A0ACB9KAQ9_9ASTR|nr:hypothetical protein L1987_03452 [Smallanthus sonchifolius]